MHSQRSQPEHNERERERKREREQEVRRRERENDGNMSAKKTAFRRGNGRACRTARTHNQTKH